MEEQDKVKYQELKERTENVLFDNVKGQIDVSKHRQLIVDIVDTVGKDVEKITDNSTDMNQKLEEYKESQSELNAKQDININKNLQNINQLNDMIKVLSQKDEPIMSANGGGVISLPNNAMRSVAPNYKFEGLTLNQLVENGDFRDGLKGFTVGTNINADVKDGYVTIDNTVGGNHSTPLRWLRYTIKVEEKNEDVFYINVVASGDNSKIKVGFGYSFGETTTLNGNIKTNVSYIPKNISAMSGANIWTDSIANIYQVTCYNLTQTFGAGNEPTKEWCDKHITGYFEGVKSVQTPLRIKSVGENLINISKEDVITEYYVDGNGANNSTNLAFCRIKKINVKGLSGDFYINSKVKSGFFYSVWTYRNGVGILRQSDEKFTILPEDEEIGISFKCPLNDFEWATITKTKNSNYTPYVESNLYINNQLELRSVGTTKDYIEDGKLYKNIGYIEDLSKLQRYTFDTERNENVDILVLKMPKDAPINSASKLLSSKEQTLNSVSSATVEDIGKLCVSTYYISNILLYYVKKGTSVTDAQKQLENVWLYYCTDTKIIDLDTSGLVTNHPNGTIFLEPITNVTAYYNDGLDVSNFNIVEIEEFAIFKDGNYQNLDVSKIEITENKLTHLDAINGLCYLVFRYDNNPIFGDNEVEYYNNNGILVSPDGTFWKPVLTVDDEGNILMKGEKL